MSADDLESYENDLELDLYREYRDVVSLFSYVVETERRFYLTNAVDVQVRTNGGEVFFELSLEALREVRPRRHLQGRQRRGAHQAGDGHPLLTAAGLTAPQS